MIIIGELYKEFSEHMQKTGTYRSDAVEEALALPFSHPNLTERLANLSKQGVRMKSRVENPWYTEMKQHNVSEKQIEIIKEYVRFKEKNHREIMDDFKRRSADIGAFSPNYRKER